MISDAPKNAFVWIYLPGETEPVVAGRLQAGDDGSVLFNYGKSYLERAEARQPAIPLYAPELPLQAGAQSPPGGLSMFGCIGDASPDAWGRRVILNKMLGRKGAGADTAELDELTYLLESGSDRIGALDFQLSPTEYIPRAADNVELEELLQAAARLEAGEALSPELDRALLHGSSIGGARPKAQLQSEGVKYIAKFPSSKDLYNVIKAEFIAMRLAALAGLDAAPVHLVQAAKRDVLLVERFDRIPKCPPSGSSGKHLQSSDNGKHLQPGDSENGGWTRRAMVSALTLLDLDEMMAQYASYEALAEIIRHRFTAPQAALRELFSRLVFNVCCGNTDDHARNHAAFWDGTRLSLTPAYDICPQGRTGNEASQGMLVHGRDNRSRLATCLQSAHNFHLSETEARQICTRIRDSISEHWSTVCDQAQLPQAERRLFWHRQFLNPDAIAL